MSAALHASPLKRSPLEEQYHQWSRQSSPVDSPQSDTIAPLKKKRVYKKRKPTHTVRKEEKQALEKEIQALQAKLEALKFQTLVLRGDEDKSLKRQEAHNAVLRDVIQEQHLVLANTQAMLLGCAQRHSYEVRPTEMFIHLGMDQQQRRATLDALRVPKLNYARRFIQQRSMGLHPTAAYFHEERYETPEGDFCNVRFDRTPLKGVTGGVRAVADALMNAAFNAEIILSEASGNITIREDDDWSEDNLSHMRLLTRSTRGVLVENNLVRFADLSGLDGGGTSALATTDFVDEDDRYPYRPHERIRRDATSVVMLTSHVDTSAKGEQYVPTHEDVVVVVTRWAFTRICHTELNVSSHVLREMRDLSGRISELFLDCIRETVGLPKPSYR